MSTRRELIVGSASLLATPYFFFPKIVKADALTDGLVKEISLVTDNLSMRPAGPQTGTDLAVAGGGTIFGRSVRGQADMMASGAGGGFTEILTTTAETRQVC